ncbi:MACPF domain-containing protein-like protein [Tanacetum coccineum]
MQFTNITETSSKDGLTIIECKRGGDVFSDSHSNWLQTVSANPKAMLFKFVPITSLLNVTDHIQLRGSDEYDSKAQFLDRVRWKRYSNICSSVVKRDPNWLNQEPAGGVFIVTGAQLISKGKWPKTILHLRLHFTHIPNCTIRKIEWAGAPAVACKSSLFTNISSTFTFTQRSVANGQKQQQPATLNSGVFPDSPPVPVRSTKLRKYVDTVSVYPLQ